MPPRLVLDTNVWLDLLVFGEPSTAWILEALGTRRLEARIDDFALVELERVLGYPLGRFAVAPADRAGLPPRKGGVRMGDKDSFF